MAYEKKTPAPKAENVTAPVAKDPAPKPRKEPGSKAEMIAMIKAGEMHSDDFEVAYPGEEYPG